jgi:hypothetical protein
LSRIAVVLEQARYENSTQLISSGKPLTPTLGSKHDAAVDSLETFFLGASNCGKFSFAGDRAAIENYGYFHPAPP